MKKAFATLMLVAAFGAQVGAFADQTGHIRVNNPTTIFGVPGASELVAGCEPGGVGDGVDGQWFEIEGGIGLNVTLTDGFTGVEDLDVYFYTADCSWIDDLSMATENQSEAGTAPGTAAYAVVDLVFGADAHFTVGQ